MGGEAIKKSAGMAGIDDHINSILSTDVHQITVRNERERAGTTRRTSQSFVEHVCSTIPELRAMP
jgi:hypothetical protein